jgi:hypothetical protein
MKHLAFVVILFSFVEMTNAQTSKGSFVVGFHNFSPSPLVSDGSVYNLFPETNAFGISFGNSKTKLDGEELAGKESNIVVGLSLNSHYFVADHFAIGLMGNFSSASSTYKEDGEEDDKSSFTIFLVGPELRYYFDTGAKTKCWIKGGASIGSASSSYNGEKDDPTSLTQYGGGAGISIFPVPAVSIDFGMGYNVFISTDKIENLGDYKSITSGLALDIGAGFFF